MKTPLYIRTYKLRRNNILLSKNPRLVVTDRPVYFIVWKDDYTASDYDKLHLPSNYSFIFQTTDRKYSPQETNYQFNQAMKDKDEFIYLMDDDIEAGHIYCKSGRNLQDILNELDTDLEKIKDDYLATVNLNWRDCEGTTRNIARAFYILNFKQLADRGIFFDRNTNVAEDVDISLQYFRVTGKLPILFRDKHMHFRMNDKSLAPPEYKENSYKIIYDRYKDLPISFTLFMDNKEGNWVLKPNSKLYKSAPYFDDIEKAKEYVKTKPDKFGIQKAHVNFS